MLNEKISTLVLDKDKASLADLMKVLDHFYELEIVAHTTSAKQGYGLLNQLMPQLVIINVDLDDSGGLDFAKNIRNRELDMEVVFIAHDNGYAYRSLSLEPVDYLLSPVDNEALKKMIARLKHKMKKKELFRKMDIFIKSQTATEKRIFHQKKGVVVLHLHEIIYGKAQLSSVCLYLRNGEEVIIKSNIKETLEILNKRDFIRTGRSHFINHYYLWKIDKKNLKCILSYEGQNWDVPASRSSIMRLDKLNVHPIY